MDFVFDVVGRRATFEHGARRCSRPGGTLVLIGLSPAGERAELDLPAPLRHSARGSSSRTAATTCRRRISRGSRGWALDGTLDLAAMVTRTAPLDGLAGRARRDAGAAT